MSYPSIMFVKFIYSITLGSICRNSISEQERWCVVLDCHILHLELTVGVSGMVHVHALWAKEVNPVKIAGCQLLKPVLILSLLHFPQFH